MVVLNVGGVKYTTTIQTLLGFESMLKARFSGNYSMEPQNDGSYFFDRDGDLFKYILQYMRTGGLLLPETWTRTDLLRLYQEATYFSMSSLSDELLLKLFNSNIVTHDQLKREIISKIKEAMPTICQSVMDIKSIDDHGEGIMGPRSICPTTKWTLQYKYDVSESKVDHITLKEELERSLRNSEFSLLLAATEFSCIFGQFMSRELDLKMPDDGKANTLVFSLRNRSNMDRPQDPIKDIQYRLEYHRLSDNERVLLGMNKSKEVIGNEYFSICLHKKDEKQNIGGFTMVEFIQGWELDLEVEQIEVWRIPTLPQLPNENADINSN